MMTRTVTRARLLALVAAVPLALLIHPRASGQEPALEVFYTKLEPKDQFKYKWKGKEAVCTAGVFRWEVPASEFGTNGLDRNFTGYCAEVLVPIVADKMYRFRVNSLFAPANYGLEDHPNGPVAAERRARYIQEMFGRYYRDPITKSINADEALAFQVALWEIIQETEPAEGGPKRDLFAGDFQANYPKADAPAYVLTAQKYLDSLTGDDLLYYENPDLRGRELIRLMGIENAEKVVAQSQFALRFVGGGGVGGTQVNLAAGAAVGGGGLGGGLGGGFGGGLGSGGFGTGGGGSNSPSTPVTTTTPGGGTTVTTDPPTTTVEKPPGGGKDEPTPVPAPAGLILGAIALGTLGSWRLGAKWLAAK
jgi:hypothetical protein